MCETCGCGDPEVVPIEIQESILAENDHTAAHNREHFHLAGTLAINIMGSPGSGKTALLEATATRLGAGRSLAALSGDLATENDARRLRSAGIPSQSITTGSACHLDARLVHHALHHMEWQQAETLFIENVGNLVCPAIYDLGQDANVVALAVTEGEDKPDKYPVMFRKADLVLLTKIDLLPHLPGVRVEEIRAAVERTAPRAPLLPVSAVTGDGIDEWVQWLEARRRVMPAAAPDAVEAHHHHHVAHHHE